MKMKLNTCKLLCLIIISLIKLIESESLFDTVGRVERDSKDLLRTKEKYAKIAAETVGLKHIEKGKRSLVFVFDGTGSMWNELQELIEGATMIFDAIRNRTNSPIQNYIFVPYRDPEIGPITVTTNDTEFKQTLKELEVFSGGDCPEMALTAIIAALEACLPYSYIYVFSDATAKDHALVDDVLKLVQRKKSQVVFVLTGDCKDRDQPTYQVFERIASVSSGQIFHLRKTEVFKVLQYVNDNLEGNVVNLASNRSPKTSDHNESVPIDITLEKVTVSVAGGNSKITISNPSGEKISEPPKVVKILDLTEIKILKIINPEPGNWTVSISSDQDHSVKVTGVSEIEFDYGFYINNTDSFTETSNRPLKGTLNHLLVGVKNDADKISQLDNVEITNTDGKVLYEIPLVKDDSGTQVYKTEPFIPPDDFFYITVNGMDKEGNSIRRVGSTAITSQIPEIPYLTVKPEVISYPYETIILNCKFESLIPVSVQWLKDNVPVQDMQTFYFSNEIEYIIKNVTNSTAGSYTCKADNLAGISTAETIITLIGEPPKLYISPQNYVSKYDAELELECIIESGLPIKSLKFYLEGTNNELEPQSHNKIRTQEKNTISIYKYSIKANNETAGRYVCEAANRIGSVSNKTIVEVVQPLKITVDPKTMIFQNGDNITFLCTIENADYGRWKFNNKIVDFDQIIVSDTITLILNIKNASKADEGSYHCLGYKKIVDDSNSDSVLLSYVEKPQVYLNETNILIHIGADVTLYCGFSGIPEPKISWVLPEGNELDDLNKDYGDVRISDGSKLQITNLQLEHEGEYTCKAENLYGSSEKSLQVKAWQMLYLTHNIKDKTVKLNDNVTLNCPIDGVPVPIVIWYHNEDTLNIQNDDEKGTILNLNHVKLEDNGTYTCIGENEFESKSHQIILTVTGSPPIIEFTPENVTLRPGKTIFIECLVKSDLPLINILLYNEDNKNARKYLPYTIITKPPDFSIRSKEIILSNDTKGLYGCEAINHAGIVNKTSMIDLLNPLQVYIEPKYIEFEDEGYINYTCHIYGSILGSIEIPNSNENFNLTHTKVKVNDGIVIYMNISSASITNEGSFVCSGYRGTGNDRESLNDTAEAKYVKRPILNEIPLPLRIKVGDTATLLCNVSGIPVPFISWILPNSDIVSTINIEDRIHMNDLNHLIISDITPLDDGEYKCIAKNTVGSIESDINITTWSEPYFKEEFKNVTGDIYENKNLTCIIEGKPKPKITWYFNEIKMNVSNILEEMSILPLFNITIEHEGKYTCFGENDNGVISSDLYFKVTGLEPPEIIKDNDKITVIEGETFKIICRTMKGKPIPELKWSRKDEKSANFQVIHSEGNAKSLMINNISKQHEGEYTCTAENIIGFDNYTFYLEINYPPHISILHNESKNDPITVVIGNGTELICDIKGNPKPSITWSKDGSPLINYDNDYTVGDDKLIIENTKETHAGRYSCNAKNKLGDLEQIFDLDVLTKPDIDNFSEPLLKISEGQTVTLPCTVNGNPTPEIKWFFNDTSIEINDQNDIDKNHTLRFNATLSDSGVYKCVADNKVDVVSQETVIIIFLPPSIHPEENEDVIAKAGSFVIIECNATGFPKPVIKWSQNNNQVEHNTTDMMFNNGRLTLSNLTQNHSGTVVCTAENEFGSSHKMFNIIINEPPKILSNELNSTIQIRSGSEELIIPCKTSGNPAPKIQWLFNNTTIKKGIHTEVKNDGTLVLSLLTEDLSGIYKCQAENNEGSFEVEFNIQVIEPPTIIYEEDTNITIATEGDNLLINCPLKPSAFMFNINWYKNSVLLENENSVNLNVINLTRDDANSYSCFASNPMGNVTAMIKFDIQWPPSLINQNTEDELIDVLNGDELKLNCDVDSNPPADIYWIKYSTMIRKNTAILKEDNVNLLSAGEYICNAENDLGKLTKKFIVNVMRKPTIDGPEISNVTVKLGNSVFLECIVDGVPKPDILWNIKYIPDWTLTEDKEKINSFNISKQSEGLYSCEATNKVGSALKQYNITIVQAPSIINIQLFNQEDDSVNVSTDVSVVVENMAMFSCVAVGSPKPEIVWLRKGTVIAESELNLLDIKKKDSGKYTCIATNNVGSDQRDINVKVLEKPMILYQDGFNKSIEKVQVINAVENQYVALNCYSDGNPAPIIYWFKDDRLLDESDENISIEHFRQVLSVKRILKQHSGSYKCVVKSSIGEDSMTFLVDVGYSPQNHYLEEESKSVTYIEGENIELECIVDGNPIPTTQWLKTPYVEGQSDKYEFSSMDNRNILIIKNASYADRGSYTCLSTNPVGSTEFIFNVNVLEVPKIEAKSNYDLHVDEVVNVQLRRQLQLICNATGYPEPEIYWYKDRKHIGNEGKDASSYISWDRKYFSVFNALLDDAGLYTCIAENKAGSAQHVFNVKVLVPAEWGLWSRWSACSISCGHGYSRRTRKCQFFGDLNVLNNAKNFNSLNGNLKETSTISERSLPDELLDTSNCIGNPSETRECFIMPCKVDGAWSDWSSWTDCSVQCGKGVMKRYRDCSNPAPKYGGSECIGSNNQQRQCSGNDCSTWSPWTSWTPCSVTCGSGTKQRFRHCNGSPDTCLGNAVENDVCAKEPCRVRINGGWSPWSNWSACSVSCGSGKRKRSRICNLPSPMWGGRPCKGGNLQIEWCDNEPCEDEFEDDQSKNRPPFDSGEDFEEFKPNINNRGSAKGSLRNLESNRGQYLPYAAFNLPSNTDKDEDYLSISDEEESASDVYRDKKYGSRSDFATGGAVPLTKKHNTLNIKGLDLMTSDEVDHLLKQEKFTNSEGDDFDDLDSFNPCPNGFIYHTENRECHDVDECRDSNICHSTQMCVNLPGDYKCLCEIGYTSNGNGQRCLDVDECKENKHNCSHGCFNIAGGFVCSCPSGFQLSEDKITCEKVPESYTAGGIESKMMISMKDKKSNVEQPPRLITAPLANLRVKEETEDPEWRNIEEKLNIKLTSNIPKINERPLKSKEDCSSGYYYNSGKCEDIDECSMNMNSCDGVINICMNTRGTHLCIPTPCSDFYRRDTTNGFCVQRCDTSECSEGALIQQKMVYIAYSVQLEHIILPGRVLNINFGGELNSTLYTFDSHDLGDIFYVNTDQLKGVLYSKTIPRLNHVNRIVVSSRTYDESFEKLLTFVEYIIYIYISK